MKFAIDGKSFGQSISTVGKIISRPAEPILNTVLITANDNSISLYSTNLEQAITYTLEAEVTSKEGISKSLVPYDLLKDIASKLKDAIEIDLSEKNVTIRDQSGSFVFNALNPDAVSEFTSESAVNSLTMNSSEFKELLENTAFAASTKANARREFRAVYLDIKNGVANFVATDSTALALNSIPYNPDVNISLLIPIKAVDILTSILPDDAEVKMDMSENVLKVSFGNISFSTLLINSNFPDYNAVIPKEFPLVAQVKKEDVLNALELVEPVAKKGTGKVTLTFAENVLVIEANSDVGNASKIITCSGNAEITLQFYIANLIEGIEHAEGDTITFGMQKEDLRPMTVKGEKDNYVYVIMPQRSVT